jgi:hypothetical protein
MLPLGRRLLLFLSCPFQDILVKEGILHAHGIDDAEDDDSLPPVSCRVKTFDPQSVLLSQMDQGGLIKRENMFGQFPMLLSSFIVCSSFQTLPVHV